MYRPCNCDCCRNSLKTNYLPCNLQYTSSSPDILGDGLLSYIAFINLYSYTQS